MEDLNNAVRREAERVQAGVAGPQMALVTGYDPARYRVKVKLQPGDNETGWIPIMSAAVGNGFGISAPPALGDQVVVVFQENNIEAGVVLGSVYNDEDRPPVEDIEGTPSGESRIVNKSGSRMRLLADGMIEIRANAGTIVTIDQDGQVIIKAGNSVLVQAESTVEVFAPDVKVGAEGGSHLAFVMSNFMTTYNLHTHPQVGPVQTGQMTTAHLTTNTKAS